MNITNLKILFIEDDAFVKRYYTQKLESFGQVEAYDSLGDALSILRTATPTDWDICICDLHWPDGGEYRPLGLKALKAAQSLGLYTVALSSSEDPELIEQVYSAGVQDYFVKDAGGCIQNIMERYIFQRSHAHLSSRLQETFLTRDPYTLGEINKVKNFLAGEGSLFLYGPIGVGKELLISYLREGSEVLGMEGGLCEIDCQNTPFSELEQQLFGGQNPGFIELSHKGILCLKEVHALPSALQIRFQKVLQDKVLITPHYRIPREVDFLLVTTSSTSKVPPSFLRYTGLVQVELTPLRERPDDIGLVIETTLQAQARRPFLMEETKEFLLHYPWPGNLVEIKKVLQEILNLGKAIIAKSDLNLNPHIEEIVDLHPLAPKLLHPPIESYAKTFGMKETISQIKFELVSKALEENQGKIHPTIHSLKISCSSFYGLLDLYPQLRQLTRRGADQTEALPLA